MKNFRLKHFEATVVALFLYGACFAQMSSAAVDSLVNYAMGKFNVAGMAVAIVKDGKIVHEKGYGIKSVLTNSPVDEHTNFGIASNTKAFTTTALAILVEEGKLSWDDKVKTHIPEFTMYSPYVAENFIIDDLLTHRSGLGLGMGDLMFFPEGADFTIDDLLSSFQHFKPVSQFRTKWDYDNLLYIVAGEVIARVSGMSWEDFIQKRILDPLQMSQTYPSLDRVKDKSNIATPHDSNSGELKPLPNFKEIINGAAGAIMGNVHDLGSWMLVHLNHGKYGSNLEHQLFSEDSQREMWKLHTIQEANRNPRYNSHFAGYGLGWGLTDVLGNLQVSHTGGLPGMLSRTVMIPDINLGVVVLTNTSDDGGPVFSAVSQAIVDRYLGLDDAHWVDRYYDFFQRRMTEGDKVTEAVWEQVKNADASQIDVNNYIGMYKDVWFGTMEVFMKGDQLWIKSHRSPKLNGPMSYYGANTFAIKWEYQDMNADAFAMFTMDENGKGAAIKMKGISPNIDFSFDFQDLDLKRVLD